MEALFSLYAQGKIDELFDASLKLLDRPSDNLQDGGDIDRRLVACLLYAVQRELLTEIAAIDRNDENRHTSVASQKAVARLESLHQWNHLSEWQELWEQLQSIGDATDDR